MWDMLGGGSPMRRRSRQPGTRQAPDPMRNRRIDENRPQADEPKHGGEFHAFSKRASDQCRRNDGKRHLKADVHAFGDGRGWDCQYLPCRCRSSVEPG